MDYSFAPYLESLSSNWYEDDTTLQRLLAHYAGEEEAQLAREKLGTFGALCAGELADLSKESSLVRNRPYLRHFDAHNRRVDDVVMPTSSQRALELVQGRYRLGAVHGNPYTFYSMGYLYAQNGESGVGCSMACTDGLVRAVELLGTEPIHKEIVDKIRNSTEERVYHGAQFVTEIQGGSDAATNDLLAEKNESGWRLSGQKWFCSNIIADYFLVTARTKDAAPGGRGVSLFVVPAYLDDNRGERNGYRIDRLKEKLGTRELPTAEVTFDGAEAYQLGPLDRGLANVVSLVLVTSRFACSSVAASFLRSAERVAEAYADFRAAFGQPIAQFPLVRETLATIRTARKRTLGTLFELLRMFEAANSAESTSTEALDFRYLMSMAKPVLTHQATQLIHECIMILGGNGIEEEFCILPRLWRDSIIMETWEGPHNVLFSQALRDMTRFEVDPAAFVTRMTGKARPDLSDELATLLAARDLEATVPFSRWAERLVEAVGDRVIAEAAL